MSLRRRSFVSGLTAAVAAGGVSPALARGARSGDWCLPLSKFAREHVYDFSLALLDGGVFTLSETAGKPVWLVFFATWCPPCNDEAGDVVRIARKYGDAVSAVAIDVGEEPPAIGAFRERHGFTLPIALDPKSAVFHGLGFHGLPTHVFVNHDGTISCISAGDLTAEQMDNELAVALARVPAPSPAPSG